MIGNVPCDIQQRLPLLKTQLIVVLIYPQARSFKGRIILQIGIAEAILYFDAFGGYVFRAVKTQFAVLGPVH